MNTSCKLRGTTTAFDSVITKGWKPAAGKRYLMNALRSAHDSSSDSTGITYYEHVSCLTF